MKQHLWENYFFGEGGRDKAETYLQLWIDKILFDVFKRQSDILISRPVVYYGLLTNRIGLTADITRISCHLVTILPPFQRKVLLLLEQLLRLCNKENKSKWQPRLLYQNFKLQRTALSFFLRKSGSFYYEGYSQSKVCHLDPDPSLRCFSFFSHYD